MPLHNTQHNNNNVDVLAKDEDEILKICFFAFSLFDVYDEMRIFLKCAILFFVDTSAFFPYRDISTWRSFKLDHFDNIFIDLCQ